MEDRIQQERLLREALLEIKWLRRQNELMGARLEMFDSMMNIFNARPPQIGALHKPDVAYDIEKYLDSIKDQESMKNK